MQKRFPCFRTVSFFCSPGAHWTGDNFGGYRGRPLWSWVFVGVSVRSQVLCLFETFWVPAFWSVALMITGYSSSDQPWWKMTRKLISEPFHILSWDVALGVQQVLFCFRPSYAGDDDSPLIKLNRSDSLVMLSNSSSFPVWSSQRHFVVILSWSSASNVDEDISVYL